MKKRTPVSKIMTTELMTVNKNNSLREVDQLIKEKHIRHVPVVSGDKLVGMLSKTDLERINFVNDYNGGSVATQMYDALTIEQVMTKNIQTVHKDDTILEVATILSEHEFHALPVLDEEKIVGIVTTKDLLDYLIEQY